MLAMIAAFGRQQVIGHAGQMPWHLPADLAWFKRNTLGKPVIMGRNTWESLGRALPGRRNLVISRDPQFQPKGAECFNNPQAAFAAAQGTPEIMVIGGAQIYQHFLPQAMRLYLTLIDADFNGDTFFPNYQRYSWRETQREEHAADAQNPYPYTFLILEREA
ncbi:MAG: type 3 dihydrofolate reductase [Thiothrix sp.]